MQVIVEISDVIAQQLNQRKKDLARCLLAVIGVDTDCDREINSAEVRQILQLPTWLTTHAFLKQMAVDLNYDKTELKQDLQTFREFESAMIVVSKLIRASDLVIANDAIRHNCQIQSSSR